MSLPSVGRRALQRLDNPYLLLALASLFWSGNHIVGRALTGYVPPFTLATLRWLIATLVLWPIGHAQLMRDGPLIRRHWRILLLLGITGGALFSALQFLGLQITTALNTSVFNSLGPVMIAAVGALMFRDRLTPLQMLGIATSLAGALAIVTRCDPEIIAQVKVNVGDVLIFFNMAVFAVYSVYYRRCPPIHWLSLILVVSVISVVGTLPLMIWELAAGLYWQPTPATALAIAYCAFFPSVAALVFWNRGVVHIGANRAGVFMHLVPLYSAVLATALLGERLFLYHVLGFALILTGVRLAARGASPPEPHG
ncbi:MAG: DMT family transporter [Proteobacteria bacterium]|nr:DMT family transporter [Pseudomonadota bacterium]